jgi:branched-chain amino acid transport system ATP-binding protein
MTSEQSTTLLALEDVSVSFGGLNALSNVSFAVTRGEIVGLIGPNGAGKTTAFNVACGFVRPSTGTVRFPEAGLSNLRPDQLTRAGVSRTMQGVGLFTHCSVLENVMAGGQSRPYGDILTGILGLRRGAKSEATLRQDALDALDRLGIASFAEKLPSEIPYGISKKVSVARAMLANPGLIMLDEPASGLDESELDEFAALITELRQSMGVILVEHNMDFVMPLVDRLVVLNFGHVIASGTPREIRHNPEVLAAYLGVDE